MPWKNLIISRTKTPPRTVFRDVILLALIGFVAMVVMLLPHLQPPQEEQEEAKAPGNVMVEMHWPNDMPYDVDLWVKAAG